MSEQTITLYSAGSLPGIPGDHAPGTYLVDYETRTIRPAVDITNAIEAPEEETSTQPTQEEPMPDVVPVPNLPQEPAQESIQ